MITEKDIQAFIDGSLSDEKKALVRKAIESDADLAKIHKTLKQAEKELRLSMFTPPPSFTSDVMSNLHKKVAVAYSASISGLSRRSVFLVLTITGIILIAGTLILTSDLSLANIFRQVFPQEVTVRNQTLNFDPVNTLPFSQELFIKGIVYLNAFLVLLLLERAIIRPYFRERKNRFSF